MNTLVLAGGDPLPRICERGATPVTGFLLVVGGWPMCAVDAVVAGPKPGWVKEAGHGLVRGGLLSGPNQAP